MSPARIAVLGLGKMGSAMALRLREHGHAISVWNRSAAKAEQVREAALPGPCVVGETASAALTATSADAAVLLVLSNTSACLEVIESTREHLRGRTVVNLTSGNPDEARQVAAALAAPELGVRAYLDGAYCGPPAKARQGGGVLFISSDAPADAERLKPTLSLLGEYAYCGPLGTSRAIDYAVVDLALVCYKSFLSNVEMLEREGVQRGQLYEHMGKRLATVPAAIGLLHARLAERSDAAYHTAQVASLETLRDFWRSRLPYFEAHGIPDGFARYMASLCEAGAGGSDGPHWGADVARIQEVMRPAPAAEPRREEEREGRALAEPPAKRGRPAGTSADSAAEFQVVDVFTRRAFSGNPTCVCFLGAAQQAAMPEWMAKVARESGQPTTSFVDERASSFRTFGADGAELPLLSGHSALGIGAALTARGGATSHTLASKYGEVVLRREQPDCVFELALPAVGSGPLVQFTPVPPLARALGVAEAEVLSHGSLMGGKFYFVELDAASLGGVTPDIAAIRQLPSLGLIAMAQGMIPQQNGYVPECVGAAGAPVALADFTCRHFIPRLGVDEDVATGSIQVPLYAYWAARLGKEGQPLLCLQASRRGGFVRSRSPGDGLVYVAGHTALSFGGTMPF